jgi:hypothetical protein
MLDPKAAACPWITRDGLPIDNKLDGEMVAAKCHAMQEAIACATFVNGHVVSFRLSARRLNGGARCQEYRHSNPRGCNLHTESVPAQPNVRNGSKAAATLTARMGGKRTGWVSKEDSREAA